MCRELRKKDVLQEVLRLSHDRSLNKYASIDEEDDFQVKKIYVLQLFLKQYLFDEKSSFSVFFHARGFPTEFLHIIVSF